MASLNERIIALYNQGLTYSQIAAELKTTYSTVSLRLNRMRKRGKKIPYRIVVWGDRKKPKSERLPRNAGLLSVF